MLGDDVPAAVKQYAENIDNAGRHLNAFARDVFHDSLQAGIGYILVDHPPAVTRDDGMPVTADDPYVAALSASD